MTELDTMSGIKKDSNISRLREIGIIFPLFFFGLIIAIRNPYFVTWENIRYILLDASILNIVAIGEMMVILTGE